jgi:hypothetical protein
LKSMMPLLGIRRQEICTNCHRRFFRQGLIKQCELLKPITVAHPQTRLRD